MKIVATLAAVSAIALMGAAAHAQSVTASAPVANLPPMTTPPTTANADTGYSGSLHGQAFREIEPRIADLRGKAGGKRAALGQLSKIEGEAKYRRSRHGGELRDWDRELLNKQLDQVQAMIGG